MTMAGSSPKGYADHDCNYNNNHGHAGGCAKPIDPSPYRAISVAHRRSSATHVASSKEKLLNPSQSLQLTESLSDSEIRHALFPSNAWSMQQTVRMIVTGKHTADVFLEDAARFPLNPYSQRHEDLVGCPAAGIAAQFALALGLVCKGDEARHHDLQL
jgi:hypothetical protein